MTRRQAQGSLRLGRDHVHHRLGLCQIETSVQKSPLREFPRLRQPGAVRKGQRQGPAQDHAAPVALDLRHVFPGIGMGGAHEKRDGLIHRRVTFYDIPVNRPMRRGFRQITAAPGPKHPIRHGDRLRPGKAQNTDAAFP